MDKYFYQRLEDSENRYKKAQKSIKAVIAKIDQKVSLAEINTNEEVEKTVNRAVVPVSGVDTLERIINESDLLPVNYMRIALIRARSVARVIVRNKFGQAMEYGTGFLVSPRLLMTNNHVIESASVAKHCTFEFNYETDLLGQPTQKVSFKAKPDLFFVTSPSNELDYTIVALETENENGQSLSQFGCIPLLKETGKILIGQSMSIIQHPNGEPKQIAIRDNVLLKKFDDRLLYKTDTMGGSSGAAVFNDAWEVVALHHSGVPDRDDAGNILTIDGKKWQSWMGEHKVKWIGNEGIRISSIIADLENRKLKGSAKDLRQELFDVRNNPGDVLPDAGTGANRLNVVNSFNGNGQSFEVLLSNNKELQKLAVQRIAKKFKANIQPLFDGLNNDSGNSELKRFKRIHLVSDKNPWDVARELKQIEGVDDVDPILEIGGMEDPDDDFNEKESTRAVVKGPNKEKKEKRFKGLHPTWNLEKTFFPQAVEFSKKAGKLKTRTSIKVAQIDTGYTDHPEVNKINKKAGYDFVSLDEDARDDEVEGVLKQPGHGTRTASIIVGEDTGLDEDFRNGVFPYVNYVPFRVANSVIILGTASNVTNAVLTAVKEEFDVITMCMGSYGRASWKALAKYVYDNGVIWCAAAGNEVRKFRLVIRPAAYKGVIAVAATNWKDKPWSKSSRGDKVDIAAPGQDVYVPVQYEDLSYGYNYGSGTSYATPHVAAAAALWLNHHRSEIRKLYKEPWQRVEAFRYIAKKTARKPARWNRKMGAGILNAQALIKASLPKPGQLEYAYASNPSTAFESSTVQPEISEKELIHHFWNEGRMSKGIHFESVQKEQLSTTTRQLLQRMPGSGNEILKSLQNKI